MTPVDIDAVIFDMDGLIIDSEPFWQDAEVAVLGGIGVPMTHDLAQETTGLRLDSAIAYWHSRFPWDAPAQSQIVAEIQTIVIDRIATEGTALPGFAPLLSWLVAHNVPRIIASSSHSDVINAVIHRLGIEDRLGEYISAFGLAHGKPHPEIFLQAAARIGVDPTRCLVLEDSLAGTIAAKAARMRCFAIPAKNQQNRPQFSIADAVMPDLDAVRLFFHK